MNELREKIFAWILKRQVAREVIMPQWNDVRSIQAARDMPLLNMCGFLTLFIKSD